MSVADCEKAKKGGFEAIFGLLPYVAMRKKQLEGEFNLP
jgi:hypothetical protein